MSEQASGEAADDDVPRGRGRRYAVAAVGLVLVAAAAGLGVMVGSWPPPDPQPGAGPSDSSATEPAWPTRVVRTRLVVPEFRGRTVAEASAGAEAAGGTPVIFDARWDRPVAPDWVVCTSGEAFRWNDVPTGELHIAAVPAGDPCP
jgi:hypothetical protein